MVLEFLLGPDPTQPPTMMARVINVVRISQKASANEAMIANFTTQKFAPTTKRGSAKRVEIARSGILLPHRPKRTTRPQLGPMRTKTYRLPKGMAKTRHVIDRIGKVKRNLLQATYRQELETMKKE